MTTVKIDIYKSVILSAMILILFINAQAREVVTLQNGWKFAKGQNDNAWQINFDDSKWQSVSLPHDWAIAGHFIVDGDGNTGKLPWKGEGCTKRSLYLQNGSWQLH